MTPARGQRRRRAAASLQLWQQPRVLPPTMPASPAPSGPFSVRSTLLFCGLCAGAASAAADQPRGQSGQSRPGRAVGTCRRKSLVFNFELPLFKTIKKSAGIGGGTIYSFPATSRAEVLFKLLFPVPPRMQLFVYTNHIIKCCVVFGCAVFAGTEVG
jgi:hypothetical protein